MDSEVGPSEDGPGEVGPSEDGPGEDGPEESSSPVINMAASEDGPEESSSPVINMAASEEDEQHNIKVRPAITIRDIYINLTFNSVIHSFGWFGNLLKVNTVISKVILWKHILYQV
jgi:hypothetical protein